MEVCKLILQDRPKYAANLYHVLLELLELVLCKINIQIFRVSESAQISQQGGVFFSTYEKSEYLFLLRFNGGRNFLLQFERSRKSLHNRKELGDVNL